MLLTCVINDIKQYIYFINERTHSWSLSLVLIASKPYFRCFRRLVGHSQWTREITHTVGEQILYMTAYYPSESRFPFRIIKKTLEAEWKRCDTSLCSNGSTHRTCKSSSYQWTPWDHIEVINWLRLQILRNCRQYELRSYRQEIDLLHFPFTQRNYLKI